MSIRVNFVGFNLLGVVLPKICIEYDSRDVCSPVHIETLKLLWCSWILVGMEKVYWDQI